MAADKLVALLLSLFSVEELRALFGRRCPELGVVVPDGVGPPRWLATSAVEQLERGGHLNPAFFALLADVHPARAGDIDEVRRLWRDQAAPEPDRPAGPSLPDPAQPLDVCVAWDAGEAAAGTRLLTELRAHPAGLVVQGLGGADRPADWRDRLRGARVVAVVRSPSEAPVAGGAAAAALSITGGDTGPRVVPVHVDPPGGPGSAGGAGLCLATAGVAGAAAQLVMLALRLRGGRLGGG